MWNDAKTAVLLAFIAALFVGVGYLVGGEVGLVIAFVFALVTNVGAWFFSDRLVLAGKGAQEATDPQLLAMVADLARKADLPMPKVYVVPDPQPNAFATGRGPNHAAVAVTHGLLQRLAPNEVKAVIAHELAHVAHRDTLISVIAATFAGGISMLASIGRFSLFFGSSRDDDRNPLGLLFGVIVAPFVALLVQLAVSRSREYEADAFGAKLMGSGRPLAAALQRIHNASEQIPSYSGSPATAHMYISNPFSARGWFSTHPSVEDRIERLLAMG